MLRLALLGWLLLSPVQAHEWYEPACCGGHDCHPVEADEVKQFDDGSYGWSTFKFSTGMVRPSRDGKYHVCVGTDEGGFPIFPRCIYVPLFY